MDAACDQPIEPVGEGGRVLRQLTVKDLGLFQQQERQIVGILAGLRDRRDQGMAKVDFEDRLAADAAVLARQHPLQFAVRTVTAGHEAGCAAG